ncbi:MAG TPA: efflux RND transporter periplasmic adaptor subunit [Thermoanaerobaculia bacterium]
MPALPKRGLFRRKLLWIVAVLAILLALGGWAYARRGGDETEVEVGKVGREDLQAKVTANGKVQAQKKVDISATIAGQITRLAVEEGDRVKKGQFLLQIDQVNPRAAARSTQFSMQALLNDLDSAKASREQAKADYERARRNAAGGIVAEADLQKARTAFMTGEAAVAAAQQRVDQARATFEGAQDLLSKTTIRSPIDGVVTARHVEEGEVAVIGVQNSPGTVLLTISDMSIVETEMEVDETSIPSVRVGQQAQVRVDAYPNQTFDGVVTEVGGSPLTTTTSGTADAIKFKVKIQLKSPPPSIKPGLSAEADILTGFRAHALVVPIQALVVRDVSKPAGAAGGPTPAAGVAPREEEGVYLMKDGKARFQPIKTGLTGELSIEVLSGLQGGETLVTGPFKALRTLKPDDPVRLAKPKEGGPARSAA